MEASRHLLQADIKTPNVAEMTLACEPFFSEEGIRVAIEHQNRMMDHASEYARIFSRQEHDRVRTMAAQLAEVSREWQVNWKQEHDYARTMAAQLAEVSREWQVNWKQERDYARAMAVQLAEASREWQVNWKNVGVYLDVPRIADSLQIIQSEIKSIAHLAWDYDTAASSIAKAALNNIEAFQWVNSDALMKSLEGAHHVVSLAGLPAAADYVIKYNDFVHLAAKRIDSPIIPPPKNSEEDRRDEEIGPRLVSQLEKLDPRLAHLRSQAWENIRKKNPSTLRLAAHAIREMFSEVVRMLAPDDAVKDSVVWQNREDADLARPTRNMRFEFLLGSHPEKLAAVKQFAMSLEKAHKFAHTFPEDPDLVRAYLAKVETCVYLLLTYAGRG